MRVARLGPIGKKLGPIFRKINLFDNFFVFVFAISQKVRPRFGPDFARVFQTIIRIGKVYPPHSFIDTLDFSFFNLIFFDFFFFVLAITQKVTGRFGPDFACVLPTIIRRGNNLSELSYERYFGL